jgi:hypothetical protein
VNTFYDQKNKIPMKILEFKRFRIGMIAEFCSIPSWVPNQVGMHTNFDGVYLGYWYKI